MTKHTALGVECSPKHANSTSPSAYLQCIRVDSPPVMTVGQSVSVTCSTLHCGSCSLQYGATEKTASSNLIFMSNVL